MDPGLFGGWGGALTVLIEAVVCCFYAVLLLRLAGKTTVGTARVFDFVSTVAVGTMVGPTIISPSTALTEGVVGLTALLALQRFVAFASSRSGRFHKLTTNTPRLLYEGSRFLDENLKAERITREDAKAKIREGGHPTSGVGGRGRAGDDRQRGGHRLLGARRARAARREHHGTRRPEPREA